MCNCKGKCNNGYCECVKNNNLCNSDCKCSILCTNIENCKLDIEKKELYHKNKLQSCNCKNRNCLSNYCICKKKNIKCTNKCNCCDCYNINQPKITTFLTKRKKRKTIRQQSNKILTFPNLFSDEEYFTEKNKLFSKCNFTSDPYLPSIEILEDLDNLNLFK